jgi:hypothetical protein
MDNTDTISFSTVVCSFFALAVTLLFDDAGLFNVQLLNNGRRTLLSYSVM